MPGLIAIAWFLALLVFTLARLILFWRKPAAFRWRWHPYFAALLTAATLAAFLAWAPHPSITILFSTFGLCVGVQIALGSQFCGRCGADVRNPFYRYENWPRCPKCQAIVPPTPPAARTLFNFQCAALGFLIIAGGLSLQLGPAAVALVSIVGASVFLWASVAFYRSVQVPMRNASLGAA